MMGKWSIFGYRDRGVIGKAHGFTLLEVMVSFALITVAALGLIHLQAKLAQQTSFTLQSLEALHLAEQQIERFRTRAASTSGGVGLIAFADLALPQYCGQGINALSGSRYNLTCEVKAVSGALAGELKQVTVIVSWPRRVQGHPLIPVLSLSSAVGSHQLSLNSYLSRYSEFDEQ